MKKDTEKILILELLRSSIGVQVRALNEMIMVRSYIPEFKRNQFDSVIDELRNKKSVIEDVIGSHDLD